MILNFWHWLLFFFAMVAVEILVPGAFFLWIGITALVLGMLTFFFPALSVANQLFLFGGLVIVITALGRKVMRLSSRQESPSLLNRRGQQLVGQVLTLDVPIVNGHAHVTLGDSKWSVIGPDLPAGSSVKVVNIDGTRLVVESEPKNLLP